jgi:hypothetical protein
MPNLTIQFTVEQIEDIIKQLRQGKNSVEQWDASLMRGLLYEAKALDTLTGKLEIKTDFMARKTGNLAIEVASNGKPSGISTTTADWWCHAIEGDYPLYLVMPTPLVNRLAIKQHHQNGSVRGGDNNLAEIVLVDWNSILNG